jgi:hypothetical protein
MAGKLIRSVLQITILLAAVAPGAYAACGDRPGTPINLKAQVINNCLNPSCINVSWTNTATERVWWDISVTTADGRQTGLGLSGVGRGVEGRGVPASHMFIGLQPGQALCFRVRARTARGTQGCVSKIFTGPVCATTPRPVKNIGKRKTP